MTVFHDRPRILLVLERVSTGLLLALLLWAQVRYVASDRRILIDEGFLPLAQAAELQSVFSRTAQETGISAALREFSKVAWRQHRAEDNVLLALAVVPFLSLSLPRPNLLLWINVFWLALLALLLFVLARGLELRSSLFLPLACCLAMPFMLGLSRTLNPSLPLCCLVLAAMFGLQRMREIERLWPPILFALATGLLVVYTPAFWLFLPGLLVYGVYQWRYCLVLPRGGRCFQRNTLLILAIILPLYLLRLQLGGGTDALTLAAGLVSSPEAWTALRWEDFTLPFWSAHDPLVQDLPADFLLPLFRGYKYFFVLGLAAFVWSGAITRERKYELLAWTGGMILAFALVLALSRAGGNPPLGPMHWAPLYPLFFLILVGGLEQLERVAKFPGPLFLSLASLGILLLATRPFEPVATLAAEVPPAAVGRALPLRPLAQELPDCEGFLERLDRAGIDRVLLVSDVESALLRYHLRACQLLGRSELQLQVAALESLASLSEERWRSLLEGCDAVVLVAHFGKDGGLAVEREPLLLEVRERVGPLVDGTGSGWNERWNEHAALRVLRLTREGAEVQGAAGVTSCHGSSSAPGVQRSGGT